MVDAIWASAQVRLAPIRIGPNEDMTTMRYFERHDRLVQAQRRLLDVAPGAFVAGHKLDIVLSATLPANPGRVLRYGWHQPDGQPIQRLSSSRQDDWALEPGGCDPAGAVSHDGGEVVNVPLTLLRCRVGQRVDPAERTGFRISLWSPASVGIVLVRDVVYGSRIPRGVGDEHGG
jgi:hypothetical protein